MTRGRTMPKASWVQTGASVSSGSRTSTPEGVPRAIRQLLSGTGAARNAPDASAHSAKSLRAR
eukprot:1913135-Pyramimonas_sp.AAC.1